MGLGTRLQHAWNAFKDQPPLTQFPSFGTGVSSWNPNTMRLRPGTERSIISAIITRIGIDVSQINIQHCRVDQNGRFKEVIQSGLNNCLTVEANIDQTGRAFIQDAVMRMCDEGSVALVPVDMDNSPNETGTFKINELRTGIITGWQPNAVTVSIYNDITGAKQEYTLPKRMVAIIENPLYEVMNEPNSTLRRLIRKLNILDAIDEQSGSGKLDLIIQLPYLIRTPARQDQAEKRRKDLEKQLAGSKYGVAYTDGTEKITQLNRPVENNLLNQITYLTEMLYSQLGITEDVMKGIADEQVMLNYYNRTIEPILSAFTNEIKRKFLTKTARSQGQSIMFFRDPFRLVPAEQLANICDTLTRNEILSSNEVRALIGYKPIDDPRADELRNKNLNQQTDNEGNAVIPMSTRQEGAPSEDTSNSNEEPNKDMNQSNKDLVNSFLEHHGIKGQKWGIKNGPPYPIGSGGRARAARQNIGYADFKYRSKTGRVLKNAGKMIATNVVAMLVPGYAEVHNVRALRQMLDKKDYVKKQGDLQRIKDLPKIPKDQRSIENDLKVINPGKGKGRINNCGYCTVAFEMRQRGYDVEARKKATGILAEQYSKWFEGVDFKTSNVQRLNGQSRKDWAKANYEALSTKLEAYGDGARGFIGFSWDKLHSGHTLAWMVKNGSVSYYDGQVGKINDWDIFSFSDQKYTYGRLDNLKLKEAVTEAVITRGGIKEK